MTEKELATNIGNNLLSARLASPFDINEVAEAMGMTPAYLKRAERGSVKVTCHQVYRFAEFYGIPIDALFKNWHSPEGTSTTNAMTYGLNSTDLEFVAEIIKCVKRGREQEKARDSH